MYRNMILLNSISSYKEGARLKINMITQTQSFLFWWQVTISVLVQFCYYTKEYIIEKYMCWPWVSGRRRPVWWSPKAWVGSRLHLPVEQGIPSKSKPETNKKDKYNVLYSISWQSNINKRRNDITFRSP